MKTHEFEGKIQSIDWILIIGIVLSPMTEFRIWKVGPGEILCLCWGMRFFIQMIKIRCYILDFFFTIFVWYGCRNYSWCCDCTK